MKRFLKLILGRNGVLKLYSLVRRREGDEKVERKAEEDIKK